MFSSLYILDHCSILIHCVVHLSGFGLSKCIKRFITRPVPKVLIVISKMVSFCTITEPCRIIPGKCPPNPSTIHNSSTHCSHVLVTGATGFIGAHIVNLLLERGVKVTGTARSEDKAATMSVKHAQETNEGTFHMILTGDLTKPNAFDDAIKGVDAIIHTASVSHLRSKSRQTLTSCIPWIADHLPH